MKELRLFSMVALILALGVGVTSCFQVKDADIQTAAQELIKANPDLASVSVAVQDKVATLTGIVTSDSLKTKVESIIAAVKNVKSVVNQLEVIPPAPDYTALDAAINEALTVTLNEFKTVTSTVKDGVITLEGEIKEKELPALLEKLNALNPVNIINNLKVK